MLTEKFLTRNFFRSERYIVVVWLLLSIANGIVRYTSGKFNNYKIFKNVFFHMVSESNLYALYPAEYYDKNLYGPLFGLIIAPFALLPDSIACLFWGVVNISILFYAITRLKLRVEYKVLLMAVSSVDLANSTWSSQFNPSIVALLLLAFVCVEENRNFWAPFWILIGAFVKLYSVVGFVLFLFSKNKRTFLIGCGVWFGVFLVAPVVITSPEFLVQSYSDWYISLVDRTQASISLNSSQDISVMGFVRRTLGDAEIPNLPFLLAGSLLVLLPLIRFHQYEHKLFRITLLSSLLVFVVLFSPGSEHPTYVICVVGIGLWLITQPVIFTKINILILIFVIGWTGLACTDLYSVAVRKFAISYALKAVPCIFVWILMQYDLLFRDYNPVANQTVLERFQPALDSQANQIS